MDYAYDLAFSLANEAICIFAGAGFSKHLTNGSMPDWGEMLEAACDSLSNPSEAKSQLSQAKAEYPLEDCAQILELAFRRETKNFRDDLAKIIGENEIDPDAAKSVRSFFSNHPSATVITTNYDLLLEDGVLDGNCKSHHPGKPISRESGSVDIYHIHGCISSPDSMVVTTNDYYEFINSPSYFSQKVETLIHENTTIIVGYSLSDPNLKAILNSLRMQDSRSINRGSLFFVTRSVVPAYVRDYYEIAFGISVIENTTIDDLLESIQSKFLEASRDSKKTVQNLDKVLNHGAKWKPAYIGLKQSLYQIINGASTLGLDIHSSEFRDMLAHVLEQKVEHTNTYGAWDQYSHLAEWLVHLGAIMDIQSTPLEPAYKEAVAHSMRKMSSGYDYGYSWNAYKTWKAKWITLTFQN